MTENLMMQQLWKRYEEDHDHLPAGTREVVGWAVKMGLLELPDIDPLDILAGKMARALREEYDTDEHGRRYRVNHAVRIMKNGVQHTFWGVLGFATRSHMEKSFTQRREQIIADCVQLKTDVDVYNDKSTDGNPIQLILDFTDDVAEREVLVAA